MLKALSVDDCFVKVGERGEVAFVVAASITILINGVFSNQQTNTRINRTKPHNGNYFTKRYYVHYWVNLSLFIYTHHFHD